LKLAESKKTKFTPALKACKNCPVHDEDWNYRSVENTMLYLAQNTRPDIAMAVHQAARFANGPRDVHSKALFYIRQYLLVTRDKGMILRPNRAAMNLVSTRLKTEMIHKALAPEMAKSCFGTSKPQTEIASTC
jgi:hypothetical protein